MPSTRVNSLQIGDGEVKRADLNTATSGSAVVTKIVQGTGISLSSTGADAGTGDVTVDVDSTVITTTGTQTLTNKSLVDASTFIVDDGDNTKKIKFQASGITTGTTRTITMPDQDVTLGSGGGISWSEVTGTTQTMAVDNGYLANNSSLVVFTLPDTAALGKIVRVVGKGSGGFKIVQNASETIHFEDLSTTVGTGGYLQSNHRRDAIELLCVVADTEWQVVSSIGNITIV
jgi:hypothetical protein